MPTYVYECARCGEFEKQQSMTDPSLIVCPKCGGKVRKIISGGTGFIMKSGTAPVRCCEKGAPCCGESTSCDKPPCGE